MTQALLYRPRQKWRVTAAFGAALLIHFAAIGVAGIQHKQIENDPPIAEGLPPVVDLEPPPTDNPIPPPDAPSPPPILNPTEDSFPEPPSTPPPAPKQVVKSVAPLHRQSGGSPGLSNVSAAKVLALSAPRPEYPYEARRLRITGDGVVAMRIDSQSGYVTGVSMSKSTGSPYLDNAAAAAFRRWRFKPGTVSEVRVPITFTMMGANY